VRRARARKETKALLLQLTRPPPAIDRPQSPETPNHHSREEVTEVYNTPLMELVYHAATVHRMYNDPAMVRLPFADADAADGARARPLCLLPTRPHSPHPPLTHPSTRGTHNLNIQNPDKNHQKNKQKKSPQVQRCTLLSIKTGGCPEDCGYCSQSSKWSSETGTKAEKLMDLEPVYEAALRAREAGSTRFCMGAAWRGPSQVGPRQWERVLEMVRRIRGLGMEVCTTLGMLTPEQASQLREAGLTAYNHNLDTSPEYYGQITTTRKYEDRLTTLENVRSAGISVCAGGIIGLGEGEKDRVGLLLQLATLPAHPESVPINRLVAVKGTPIAAKQQEKKSEKAAAAAVGTRAAASAALGLPDDDEDDGTPTGLDLVRCVATARVVMPRTVVRLSAGRMGLSVGDQALAFFAGANSIFDGDKLLTTANNDRNEDMRMFDALGLRSRPAFMPYGSGEASSKDFGEVVSEEEAGRMLEQRRKERAERGEEEGGGGGCCGSKKQAQAASSGCC
jgi:biotin synthase